jgi:hypothetical protein
LIKNILLINKYNIKLNKIIFGLQNNSKLKNKIGFLIQHVIAIVRNAQVQQCVLYVVDQMQLKETQH